MKKLYGIGVALVTPFNDDKSIDFASLKKLLAHTAKGVDYYVVMGTTGESVTLSKEEKKEVLEFVKKNNLKKLPIVYGIGGNNTQQVLEEIESTNLRGVSALLSVSPYYNKPSQEGIYQHFIRVASASPVPIILYNVPGRTASNLTAATTLRLAKHKKIIGIKEASGSLEQCMNIAKGKPKDFLIISGDDVLTLPIYSIGGVGVISVLANAMPEVFKKIKDTIASKNYPKAQQEAFKILEINGLMYEEGNPVGVKHVLKSMGIGNGEVRLPMVKASRELQRKIDKLIGAV
jgi:4-hydroxy-tetrahydrodipicolinate synthase